MQVKGIAKATVPVVLGVMIAGLIYTHFGNVGIVAQSRNGYDY